MLLCVQFCKCNEQVTSKKSKMEIFYVLQNKNAMECFEGWNYV